MTFNKLPYLPYPKNALEPYLSEETLEYHHGKHHAAYVEKLNKLILGTEFEAAPLEAIIKLATGNIFNNAAQVWNHNFYWNCLTPKSEIVPRGKIAKVIDESFGSFKSFNKLFTYMACSNFGSGWTWLVLDTQGELEIVNTSNAENPMTEGKQPLLTCDIWEHAYYIDYLNARPAYVQAFWNLVNWQFVERNFNHSIALFKRAEEPA